MRKTIKALGWFVVLLALLTLVMSAAVATPPPAPAQVAPAAHLSSPVLPFILWDTRPDHMEAYYNPQTFTVQSPYNPAKYGTIEFKADMFGFPGITGFTGKMYVFNPRANGKIGFGWLNTIGAPQLILGNFTEGVNAVYDFDILFSNYLAPRDPAIDLLIMSATAPTDVRVEITGVHSNVTVSPTATNTPIPTDTPVPPTPTTPALAAGCVAHPDNKMIVCLTPVP